VSDRRASRAAPALIALALTAAACSGDSGRQSTPRSPGPTATVENLAATLHGRATAVETTGRVEGFSTIRLEGTFLIAATVTVTSGHTQRLVVDGGPATLHGSGLAILGRLSTITAGGLVATGDPIPPKAKRKNLVRAGAYPRVFLGGDFAIQSSHALLDDKPARGPQVLHSTTGSAVLYGTARVRSLPPAITVVQDDTGRSPRAPVATPTFFSWRGSGGATVGVGRFEGRSVTLIASSLVATLTRRGTLIDVDGQGRATQVAIGRRPRLQTTLNVKVSPPGGRYYPGRSDQLTWEQINTGSPEAVVTAVRALNVAADWVRLSVDRPPPLDGPGGVPFLAVPVKCTRTAAIFAEFTLCAQIAPGHGDQEAIIFKIPAHQPIGDYEMRFEIVGNFPTVRVSIPMKVEPR